MMFKRYGTLKFLNHINLDLADAAHPIPELVEIRYGRA
jgi:hypothetical protein